MKTENLYFALCLVDATIILAFAYLYHRLEQRVITLEEQGISK